MEKNEMLQLLETIIEDARAAILATVDDKGIPATRWVSPAILSGRSGVIFAITAPRSNKVRHVKSNTRVQWIFQTRSLDKIINVEGKVNLLDNPSIRSEVLEVVGPRLVAFWKINVDERDLLVLETVIEKATYYLPMKGTKQTVTFGREEREEIDDK